MLFRSELPSRVVICQLDVAPLVAPRPSTPAPVIPRLPAIGRDIALVVPAEVPAGSVGEAVRTAGGALVEAVTLFDVYRGDPIPAGHVSLAYAVVLRDPDRTLTDEDADAVMRAIGSAVAAAGWTVRE